MKERKIPVWKMLIATLIFWAMFLAGGILVHLLNFISYAKIEPGTIWYEILRVIANPLGCFIGIAFYQQLTEESAHVSLLINCVIGAVIASILTLLQIFTPEIDIPHVVSNGLCAAVMVIGICISASDIRNTMCHT